MTTKTAILKAIRAKCLDCCGDSHHEVNLCAVGAKCPLYPFRQGTDPNPTKNRGFARVHVGKTTFQKVSDEPTLARTRSNLFGGVKK